MQYKDYYSGSKTSTFSDVGVVLEADAIKNNIRTILTTRIGSVPGKPNFGSNLHLLVFEQLDPLTEKLAERYTREALAKYEDRIIINSVSTSKNEAFHRLLIEINFSYKDPAGRTAQDSTQVSFNL